MKKLRIYIDISVAGGYFDEEFAESTRALFEMVRRGEAVLLFSDVLGDELLEAPERIGELVYSLPEECLEPVNSNTESRWLCGQYLAAGVVGQKSTADAHHVAVATVSRADMIVSWNFKHIVHYEKMRGFNSVNLREGYPPIEIHSPREVV